MNFKKGGASMLHPEEDEGKESEKKEIVTMNDPGVLEGVTEEDINKALVVLDSSGDKAASEETGNG